jgi:hypothetical protein
MGEKKRETKYMKFMENERSSADYMNMTKETLFQKFATKDGTKNVDRPVIIFLF